MRRVFLVFPLGLSILFAVGCASNSPEVRRLSPLAEPSVSPPKCRIVSVMQASPAEKGGLRVGDDIDAINGTVPIDASAVAELINKAGSDVDVKISRGSEEAVHLTIHLNNQKPRLGAVCDLTGMRKSGITSAGNESVTVFEGPFAFTGSGIIDKGIVFMRVRLTNNSDKSVAVSPELFSATDGAGAALTVMTPQQVMCYLYGEKGAQMLAVKRGQKTHLDQDTALKEEAVGETTCAGGSVAGRLSGANAEYAQSNAEYVASESLWPTTLAPSGVADGLIYLPEPSSLPITVKAAFESHAMTARFGMPQARSIVMREDDLGKFFESQKRGTPLRVTLKRGRVFVGKFTTYDSVNEKVWFDTPSGGLLSSTGFPLSSVRSAEVMEQIPPKAQSANDQTN